VRCPVEYGALMGAHRRPWLTPRRRHPFVVPPGRDADPPGLPLDFAWRPPLLALGGGGLKFHASVHDRCGLVLNEHLRERQMTRRNSAMRPPTVICRQSGSELILSAGSSRNGQQRQERWQLAWNCNWVVPDALVCVSSSSIGVGSVQLEHGMDVPPKY
jgi:hypothetical protein